jgi:tRNA-binding protein
MKTQIQKIIGLLTISSLLFVSCETVDFGDEIGIKKSSAQITDLYSKADLLNKQVTAIVNFKPRQIANFMSECLVLGIYTTDGNVVVLKAPTEIKNGEKIH